MAGRKLLEGPPLESWDAALATTDRWVPDDPWLLPPTETVSPEPSVVVVAPGTAVVVDTPDFGRVLTAVVVVVVWADPALVVPVVAVADGGASVVVVVVGAAPDGGCGGGTSVEALQICAYDEATAGGGSLGLSGSSV